MNPEITVTEIAADVDLTDKFDGLPVAIVGGFVRDRLRGVDTNDVDLMVTEVTADEMQDRGFHPVEGASFPVFLDSKGREVALARKEVSTGAGHTAFEAHAIPAGVSHRKAVERDLERRDLTINALAIDARTGELFDPHGGVDDLENGILRHVSEAFDEDPLRVVRVARFRARTGFEIASETMALMGSVAPDLVTIPPDRFGDELIKALKQAEMPRLFFDVLNEVNALEPAFPELAALSEVPAGPARAHQEGSALEHTLQVLEQMHERRPNDVPALLAVLAHDLGKAETPPDVLPSHHGHDKRGVSVARSIRKRLGLPREFRGVMDTAASIHQRLHRVEEMTTTALLDVAKEVHSSPLIVDQIIDVGASDAAGRVPTAQFPVEIARKRLTAAVETIDAVGGEEALSRRGIDQSEVGTKVPGERVGNFIRQDRAESLREQLSS